MKKEEKRNNGNLSSKIGITFIFAILGFTEVTNGQQKPVIQNSIDVHQWIEEHFSEGVDPPFSFVYDGKNSNNFIKNWQFQAEKLKSDDPDINRLVFK